MTLESRARQLPDESVVMRYPTRAYQTDQPSACRPFCYQHTVRARIFYKPVDRSNTYQCCGPRISSTSGTAAKVSSTSAGGSVASSISGIAYRLRRWRRRRGPEGRSMDRSSNNVMQRCPRGPLASKRPQPRTVHRHFAIDSAQRRRATVLAVEGPVHDRVGSRQCLLRCA
jgi:hypothetical protein